jgi:hypothetical protein
MTSQQLPERPNLEQLKKQAKTLLHAAQAKEQDAVARFQQLPALTGKSTEQLKAIPLALHDAQSVIAREHGFVSWNTLRQHVEERTLTFAAAVDEFIRAATGQAIDRARRLLALHPGIAEANFHTALVLGDVGAVERKLVAQPELATTGGGPQQWEPILYVCHTCLHRDDPARADRLVVIAQRLLALGANANAEYTWQWHAELPRTALWGALCPMRHLALGETLLKGGARVDDGVSLHLSAAGGNEETLELLRRYGVNPNGIPGGLPPLRYILEFSGKLAGPKWLLEHGADANLAWGEMGEAPVHVVARKWGLEMMELLARHGADLERRRPDGGTPYTLAERHGNRTVAAWLRARGAKEELSDFDRFVAACARGDRAVAESLQRAAPDLGKQLRREHHLILQEAAERGDAAALEVMLDFGFDPKTTDKDGVTALHRAAMRGKPEAVRVLIARGAPLDALDGMFSASPLVWAVEGWGNSDKTRSEFPAVAHALIAAGSPVDWDPPENTPGPERVLDALAELRRAAGG